MANNQHVEIVKQGWEAIREWRAAHPGQVMDLSYSNLTGADLNLAIVSGFNFSSAQLHNAKVTIANLDGAILKGAVLFRADLSHTYLRRADLTAANLTHADLSHADLTGAVLTGAIMEETILADVDLSVAEGVHRMMHAGPSIIDERTLRKSWPLPEVFLKGVGLSDNLIEYLPSLMSKAIEFYSCFISYSSKDDEFARRLHADLQANGVRCWFAPEDLRIGDKFRVRIDEAIRLHDKLLLILSEHSVNSAWVEDEVENAFDKERRLKDRGEERTVLFPIRLDSAVEETDAAWATAIGRTRHIGDFSSWKDHDAYQTAFERLLRDLKTDVKPAAAGS